MIEKEENIYNKTFQDEILNYGNVNFFKDDKFDKFIKCKNKDIITPALFNCFLIEGKKYFI